jgi:hypothetical protein
MARLEGLLATLIRGCGGGCRLTVRTAPTQCIIGATRIDQGPAPLTCEVMDVEQRSSAKAKAAWQA